MSRAGRTGLSEYTAQRLAELRARQAEADLSDGAYKSATSLTAGRSSTEEINDGINGRDDRTSLKHSLSTGSNESSSLGTGSNESGGSSSITSPEKTVAYPRPDLRAAWLYGRAAEGSPSGAENPIIPDVSSSAAISSAYEFLKQSSEYVRPSSKIFSDSSAADDQQLQQLRGTPGYYGRLSEGPPKVAPKTAPKPPASSPPPPPTSAPPLATLDDDDVPDIDEASTDSMPNGNSTNGHTYQFAAVSTSLVGNGSASSTSRPGSSWDTSSEGTSTLAAKEVHTVDELLDSRYSGISRINGPEVFQSSGPNKVSINRQSGVPSFSAPSPVQNGREIGGGMGIGSGPIKDRQVAGTTFKLKEEEGDSAPHLGFSNLQEQIHRKAVKKGFDFTLMVVGESGLGKSTLISSLFLNTDLYKDRTITSATEQLQKTVQIEKRYLEMEEKGVKLRLTIVDTPGFNDTLDASQCWRPVEEYIVHHFEQYLKDESGLNRRNIKDNRVHCCLYFISPYGRGLRQVDIQFMLRVHNKVNLVPVIAKADTLTTGEIQRLKARILEEIKSNKIHIYELPPCDPDEDQDYVARDAELKKAIPFAVVGSNAIVEVNGRKVKGRVYSWGIVEVENPLHSDYAKLRQFLISTHMQDLKDVTQEVHYENFRALHIKDFKIPPVRGNQNEDDDDTSSRSNMQGSSRNRDGLESDEADRLLRQKEAEIARMQEMLMKMQAQLNSEK